ncbi:FAD-dependent oxidoreductase [Actinomadura soli]|uniref:FAD-dependent oxidoreductase n=1 Tax=Actinomadura soli TaxID=2508997 RepID=A0A5C4JG36_9ACTN|nr:FAD-dependent oxidoreductase [Actinomadura soli]TMR04319.1 FAD-dependent oxidoreductase [Actinomadura soli]
MSESQVVVVGGGVVGAAVSYFLSLEGVDVTLVEATAIAAGSSGHGPGFFNTFGGDFVPGAHLALGVESVRLIHEHRENLAEVADSQDWFNDKPDLTISFTDEGAARLKALHGEAPTAFGTGIEAREWLTGEEVLKKEPLISPEVRGGYFAESVVQIDGLRLANLYTRAAQKRGARLLYSPVQGLDIRGDRATGVQLSDGTHLPCDDVVLAMGNWTPLASIWTGFPMPICSLKGQLHILKVPGVQLKHHIIERVVVMQYPNGLFLLGATPDPAPGGGLKAPIDYIRPLKDSEPIPEDTEMLMRVGIERFPFLKDAEIVRDLSGVRPMSPDLMPMIGRIPTYSNVFMSTGHGRKGIHLSAGTGKLIADLMLRGSTDLIDGPETLSPARFTPAVL